MKSPLRPGWWVLIKKACYSYRKTSICNELKELKEYKLYCFRIFSYFDDHTLSLEGGYSNEGGGALIQGLYFLLTLSIINHNVSIIDNSQYHILGAFCLQNTIFALVFFSLEFSKWPISWLPQIKI